MHDDLVVEGGEAGGGVALRAEVLWDGGIFLGPVGAVPDPCVAEPAVDADAAVEDGEAGVSIEGEGIENL
ncbi:hypothetical protein J4558_17410 [Leptolyngbya sp. 15MV]|nr:hypothetical protein J4558_17410 [Leptolyngbya sp. 15MV]